jgi:hypothetical protein
MGPGLSAKTPLATVISWATLLLALLSLAFIAWYIPAARQSFVKLFMDFKVELSGFTKLMLFLPDLVFPIAATVLAIFSLAVQWFSRSKSAAALSHMFVLMLCFAVLVAYREALFAPMSSLIRDLYR